MTAALYYGVSICLVSFASALAVVTLNIHHRGYRGDEVPKTVKSVILGYMARALFLHFDPTQHAGGTGDNTGADNNHKNTNTANNLNLKKLNVSHTRQYQLAARHEQYRSRRRRSRAQPGIFPNPVRIFFSLSEIIFRYYVNEFLLNLKFCLKSLWSFF